ncbi:hypothetical protein BEL04_23185 [Mucilaginibacter sp. PPCGB 2223]|uniref:LamG domain-containing protein n=1 Tax=Mucilaginibacter sp. PPCGB 2223 TaxID=1886027 RepID=UPI000824C826|nr:LamG domain-containing protein [Mucilaginibacter sp. PPCGB 2223]OCX50673.1 hypothetical protein BEL04_23185 [Mucilaginibacter sp. PPCGB 2223]
MAAKRYLYLFLKLVALVTCLSFMISCGKTASSDGGGDNTASVPDSTGMGMIAYYPFNNSPNDTTGNGHNGFKSNVTSVPDRNGKANSAYSFRGGASYFSIPDSAPLRLSNTDFTINVWIVVLGFDATDYTNEVVIVKRGSNSGIGWNYSFKNVSSQSQSYGLTSFEALGGGGSVAIGSRPINSNTWYMLTTTYTYKNNTLRFYVNGALDNVITGVPMPSASADAPIYIGREDPRVVNPARPFDPFNTLSAFLDDLRIYGRALSVAQIKKLFAATN